MITSFLLTFLFSLSTECKSLVLPEAFVERGFKIEKCWVPEDAIESCVAINRNPPTEKEVNVIGFNHYECQGPWFIVYSGKKDII